MTNRYENFIQQEVNFITFRLWFHILFLYRMLEDNPRLFPILRKTLSGSCGPLSPSSCFSFQSLMRVWGKVVYSSSVLHPCNVASASVVQHL